MKKWPYIFVMVGLAALYIFIQQKFQNETLGGTVTVVLAIIAAVAFWLEFKSSERLNEAKFIMDLNNQFISNPELTKIEYMLEQYCNTYKNTNPEERDKIILGNGFDINSEQRQSIVNYLVHLEGIAALVNNGVLHLKVIDDLMAYRYFIAVNNPIIQKEELLKYRDYYKGCIGIYEKWAKVLKQQNADIPMKDNALSNRL